ncbi:hypothetical protein VKS41_002616 [Umbelopsis sp. WA50703]
MSFEQTSSVHSDDQSYHTPISSNSSNMGQHISVPVIPENDESRDNTAVTTDDQSSVTLDDRESITSDSASTPPPQRASSHLSEQTNPVRYGRNSLPSPRFHRDTNPNYIPAITAGADHLSNNRVNNILDRFPEYKTEPMSLVSEVPVSASPRESSPLRHSFTNDDQSSDPSTTTGTYGSQPPAATSTYIPRTLATNQRWVYPSLLLDKPFAGLDDTAPPYDGYPIVYGKTKKLPDRLRSSSSTASPSRSQERRQSGSSSLKDTDDSVDFIDVDDIKCQICLDMIREAFITRCGHSFCYKCIVEHLDHHQTCPTCQNTLLREHIYPNFQLNKIVQKATAHKTKKPLVSRTNSPLSNNSSMSEASHLLDERTLALELSSLITSGLGGLKDSQLSDVNQVVSALIAKKRKSILEEKRLGAQVLKEFLLKVKKQKQKALEHLSSEIACIDSDLASVHADIKGESSNPTDVYFENLDRYLYPENEDTEASDQDRAVSEAGPEVPDERSKSKTGEKRKRDEMDSSAEDNLPLPKHAKLMLQRQRMEEFFGDLEECYFSMRMNAQGNCDSLSDFSTTMNKLARHSEFKVIATLRYGDISSSSSIVSAIEFDRDDEYFATAGVTKKIKIFEYGNIEDEHRIDDDHRSEDGNMFYPDNPSRMERTEDKWRTPPLTNYGHDAGYIGRSRNREEPVMRYPIKEMVCRHKISCLSWNSYIKNQMASSDYEGVVSIWDAATGQLMQSFDEHKRRTWSVDYSKVDPTLLASGSDDSTVKIWSINQHNSVCTIEKNANICCVKFLPTSSQYVAMGSADHHIHYYDLRNTKEPVSIFRGHRKAVSYVKWLNENELVSASTDSTLKLWNVRSNECVRTYTGHVNEKNFVGLSTNNDWISCGSENNAVYTYYKSVRSPLACVKFGGFDALTGHTTDEEDPSQFVSSVCWKRNSNTLLSANSQGTIKVLTLV